MIQIQYEILEMLKNLIYLIHYQREFGHLSKSKMDVIIIVAIVRFQMQEE